MREEPSVLEIFHDPLLTIIAMILLSTLWIVIPTGTSEPENGADPYQIQQKIEGLTKEIALRDGRIQELEREIQRLIDEISTTAAFEREQKSKEIKAGQEIDQLRQEIAKLKIIIQGKKVELEGLEKELKKAKKRMEEMEVTKILDQRIKRLKEEIVQKETQLKELEDRLRKTKEKHAEAEGKAKGQQEIIEKIEDQIAKEKEEVKKLTLEKRSLEKSLSKKKGILEYSTDNTKGKEGVFFEAAKNKIVEINEENYDVEVFLTMDNNGKIIQVAKATRKDSVGESIDRIAKSDSKFQAKLNELDPKKHYIFIGLQKDSIRAYKKAQQIARQRGFVVAWWPWEEGPMYVNLSDPGEEVEVEGR